MNFIGFYGVLLEFEKRMGVNMQEINSKLWIMVELWRGLNYIVYESSLVSHDDTAIFRNGVWHVDTNGDHVPDQIFGYGIAGDTPVVGDIG